MSEHQGIRYNFDPRGYVTTTTTDPKIIMQHQIVKHEPIRYTYIQPDFNTNQPAKVVQQQQVQVHAVKHEPVRVPYIQPEYITVHPADQQVKKVKQERTRFPCDQCEYAATTNSYLQKHKKVKHEGVRFAYTQAYKSDFAVMGTSYMTTPGGKQQKLKPCDQCDYVATKTSSLKHHRRSKHEGIIFPCDQCEYQATTSSNLTKHKMSKHEGIRYNCEQCEYAATLPSDLTKHIRNKHDGIKYPCDHCEFASTTTSSLRQHIRYKHEGIRFHCDQCDYAATTSSNLTKHKLSTNCILRKCDVKNKTYRNSTPIPAPILTNVHPTPSQTPVLPQDKNDQHELTREMTTNTLDTAAIQLSSPQGPIRIVHSSVPSNLSIVQQPSNLTIQVSGNLSHNVPNNLSLSSAHHQIKH